MTLNSIGQHIALGIVVLSCWLGALGMWRMREPMQALHFLSVPATFGMAALSVAVFLSNGPTQAFWKTLFIAAVMLGINSVCAHATARAFRARQLGHWQPRDGDPIEFVHDTREKHP